MENNNYGIEQTLEVKTAVATFMTKVYGWMFFALFLTALMAYTVANSSVILNLIIGSKAVFWGLLISEFVLVLAIGAAMERLSYSVLTLLFVLYSLINGATLSVIFLAYELGSIAFTFIVCAATFGAMSLWGLATKKDLSGMGKLLMMGLLGIIIASVVNIFVASSGLDWIITYIGVFVFIGLTAYDTQKQKQLSSQISDEGKAKKLSIMGALLLYLDFVNLFLYLLRLLGKRK